VELDRSTTTLGQQKINRIDRVEQDWLQISAIQALILSILSTLSKSFVF